MTKWLAKHITRLIIFLVLLAVAVWHKHLDVSSSATRWIIAGAVLSALFVLVDWGGDKED